MRIWTATTLGLALFACGGEGPRGAAPPLAAEAPAEAPPTASSPPSRQSAAAALAAPPEPTSPPPAQGETAASRGAPSEASAAAPAVFPAGLKVLHIGDSFAGALGLELNRALREHGSTGVLHFKAASFIPEWAWKGGVPLMMLENKPDLVLVTLGANEVAIQDPSSRVAVIEKLVRHLGETPCVWIGIPLWASDTGLLPVIAAHAAPCRYLDSNTLTFDDGSLVRDMPRLPDKIHPTMAARRRWAERVLRWLAEERAPGPAKPWRWRSPTD